MNLEQIIKKRNKFFDKIIIVTTLLLIIINLIVYITTNKFYNTESLIEGKYYLKILSFATLNTSLPIFAIILVVYIVRKININFKLNELKKNNEIINIDNELSKAIKSDPINNIVYTENYFIIYSYNLQIFKYDDIKNAYVFNNRTISRYGGIINYNITKIILNNRKTFEFRIPNMFEELKNRCKNSTEFKVPKTEKKLWNFYKFFVFIIYIIIALALILYNN